VIGPSLGDPAGEYLTVVAFAFDLPDEPFDRLLRPEPVVFAQISAFTLLFEQHVDPVAAAIVVARIAVDHPDETFLAVTERSREVVEGGGSSFTCHWGTHLAFGLDDGYG
jgi:hypothetical protein